MKSYGSLYALNWTSIKQLVKFHYLEGNSEVTVRRPHTSFIAGSQASGGPLGPQSCPSYEIQVSKSPRWHPDLTQPSQQLPCHPAYTWLEKIRGYTDHGDLAGLLWGKGHTKISEQLHDLNKLERVQRTDTKMMKHFTNSHVESLKEFKLFSLEEWGLRINRITIFKLVKQLPFIFFHHNREYIILASRDKLEN